MGAPVVSPLGDDEVRVHHVPLDIHEARARALHALLSDDERAQAATYINAELRRNFVAARGTLRELLGRTVGMAPTALRFVHGRAGKPALAGGTDVRFNLSHSGTLALCAVTRGRELGVDVEAVRVRPLLAEVAERFFSAEECAAVLADEAGMRARFFACWTRKEAFIKALGDGLSAPLQQFRVSVDGPAALMRVDWDPAATTRWALHDVVVRPGYVAALCIERGPVRMTQVHWDRD